MAGIIYYINIFHLTSLISQHYFVKHKSSLLNFLVSQENCENVFGHNLVVFSSI